MGHTVHDVLARVVRRHATGGGHMTRCDAECVHDETSGIGLGPSGCRDRVGTSVERVITVSNHIYCFAGTFKVMSPLLEGFVDGT